MNRTLANMLKMSVITVASSSFVLSTGCKSSESAQAPAAAAPVTISDSPREVLGPAEPASVASANNKEDLANAQPESVLSSARDVDLGGGGGGGGQAQAAPLTYQALGDMLHQMGLTPDDKKDYYVMNVKATTEDQVAWTFPITISLSQDQSVIWVTCPLNQIDKGGTPPAQTLMDLLSANFKLGLAFFVLDTRHYLILQQPISNVGVTPATLGSNLKGFFSSLKQSEPLFKNIVGVGGDDSGKNPFQ